MPATELVKRKKALFPALFMSADERSQFEARMASQVVDNNDLGQSDASLWSIISPEAIDATAKKYFDLGRTTHVVEGYIPSAPGVRPTVHVEVVTSAGGAIKNATDWDQSNLVNKYVPVTLDRYSCPFGLSSYDIMHGETIKSKVGAAIESVVAAVVNAYFTTAAAAAPTASGAAAPTATNAGRFLANVSTFGPEVVAQQVSAIFGGYGPVDDLILDPVLWAKLVPTNALGLGTEPGTYGVEYMHRTAGLNMAASNGLTATTGLLGLAVRRNGIVAGFGVPSYDETQGIAVRSLGTVAGIPLVLKSWTDRGKEIIYNSVETMAGFAVANPLSISVLTDATANSGAGVDSDTSGD